jgi:hypothetical protein
VQDIELILILPFYSDYSVSFKDINMGIKYPISVSIVEKISICPWKVNGLKPEFRLRVVLRA